MTKQDIKNILIISAAVATCAILTIIVALDIQPHPHVAEGERFKKNCANNGGRMLSSHSLTGFRCSVKLTKENYK